MELQYYKNTHVTNNKINKNFMALHNLFMLAAKIDRLVIAVIGEDIPKLEKGSIRDAANIVASSIYLQSKLKDYERTKGYNEIDRKYEFSNGSIIEFKPL